MLDLATATLALFAPHVGTPFLLDHPEHRETFTLAQANPLSSHLRPGSQRDGFELLFDGLGTEVQFNQQILPLDHAALGKLELFLVPISRNANGTIRYQAVFS